jgi:hypothetical protein
VGDLNGREKLFYSPIYLTALPFSQLDTTPLRFIHGAKMFSGNQFEQLEFMVGEKI